MTHPKDGLHGTDGVKLQKQGDPNAHTPFYGPRYGHGTNGMKQLVDKQAAILIVRQHLAKTGSRESQALLNRIIADLQAMPLKV